MAQRTYNKVTTFSDFTEWEGAGATPDSVYDYLPAPLDPTDGIVIPIFDETKRFKLNYSVLDIASVTQVNTHSPMHAHNRWQIVFTAPHGLRNGDKLNFTSTDPNASPFVPGTITIQNVDQVVNDTTILIRTPVDLSSAVAATTGASRYGSTITLGLATFVLQAGSQEVGELVRLALVFVDADRADSGQPATLDFDDRLAAGEVMWHRVYEKGSTISVDFGGISIGAGYRMPYIQDQEKVLMLQAFNVAQGQNGDFALSTELTYQIQTVIED
jgi:hypothetical protein